MSCEARAFSQPPRSDASQAYSGCSGTCNSERCRPSARLAATTCTTWHPTPPAATPTCAPAAGPRPAPTAAAAGSAAAATEQRLPPLPAASWRSYAYRTGRMKTTGRAPARARTPAAVRNFCNHFAVYMPLTSPQRGLTCQWRRGRFLRLLQFPPFSCPLIASAMLCCSCGRALCHTHVYIVSAVRVQANKHMQIDANYMSTRACCMHSRISPSAAC